MPKIMLLQDANTYSTTTTENLLDKKLNSTHYNLRYICRICLLSEKNLISTLSDIYKNVIDMYLSVTSIKVHSNNQPLQICEPCKNDLEFCFNFKNKCQKSNLVFKNVITKINSNEDNATGSVTISDTKVQNEKLREEHEEHEDVQYLEDSNDFEMCNDNVENNIFSVISENRTRQKKVNNNTIGSSHQKRTKERRKFHLCTLCSKKFLKARTLKAHIKSDHGVEKCPYSCDQCKKSFYSKHDLDLHSTIHTKAGEWTCDKCHKRFEEKTRFRRHIQRHMETKRHTCMVCGKMFAELYALRRHERVHTGELPDKPHACHLCDKRYSCRALLAAHVARHTGARPCSCSLCGKSFSSQRLLASHRLVHSDQKPHACHYCEKTFRHESTRNTHHRTHTGEKPYVCASCGKTFIQRSNLIRHMRTHTGERPYTCKFCDRKFTSGSTLKNHIRTHTGEKPYSCPVCEKRFARIDMRAHMSQHTGERPHACAVCEKRFASAWRLREHCRQHTDEKPFECANCVDKFTTKSQLMKHFKIHQRQKKASNNREVVVVRRIDMKKPYVLPGRVVFTDDKNEITSEGNNSEDPKIGTDINSKFDAQDVQLEVTEEVVLENDANENTESTKTLLIMETPGSHRHHQTADSRLKSDDVMFVNGRNNDGNINLVSANTNHESAELHLKSDGINFVNSRNIDRDINFVSMNTNEVTISSTSKVEATTIKLYQLDQSLVRIQRSSGQLTIRKITSEMTTNF